jgi:TatD DNase family protein
VPSILQRVVPDCSGPARRAFVLRAGRDRGSRVGAGFPGTPGDVGQADDLRRIAAPDDRVLVETDAPFLTPHPYRGRWPNQPAYVRFVAERIAELKTMPDDAFAALTTANAERLFALPPAAQRPTL